MSILKKPYEISVWEDVWDESQGKFIERKICVIGSDQMSTQSRAFNPNLTRNINGVKKLTFSMYKQYIDNVTGEKITNPFIAYLVSERKVKLKYGYYYENGIRKDRWYDFIVKNIEENSSTHLYSYSLEDALVQELTKNGYDVIFNSELNNNVGNLRSLAAAALSNTDWGVESEVFVQKNNEALVFLKTTKSLSVVRLIDQTDFSRGVGEEWAVVPAGSMVLAFYSSTTGKPHRFQFIYIQDVPTIDDNRIINNSNCQYYIDIPNPNNYTQYGDFYLPDGFVPIAWDEEHWCELSDSSLVQLSAKYRGAKYGFSHQAIYLPNLDRYVNIYGDPRNVLYDSNYSELWDAEEKQLRLKTDWCYGFEKTDYKSPALITNIISGASFESASGWTGTRQTADSKKATVENVYGYFDSNGLFVNALEEIVTKGPQNSNQWKAYLKLTFPEPGSLVINSGPYDNRSLIHNMDLGGSWALKVRTAKGDAGELICRLGEYKYDPSDDIYEYNTKNIALKGASVKTEYGYPQQEGDYRVWTVLANKYSEKEFQKKSQVRLGITIPENYNNETIFYIEGISLFQVVRNSQGEIITPEIQANPESVNGETTYSLEEGVVNRTYYYFTESAIENVTSEDELVPEYISKTLSYETFIPYYNQGAEKIRSLTIQESNYFNILQSLAETFEAWLTLEIERDEFGGIQRKKVVFKNYAGKDNYAGFRYGVNLKDIKRIYTSNDIVTKLIVKQNNNEYGKDGFCTIARAQANPSGEAAIYDFQYYFNQNLLKEEDYLLLYNSIEEGDNLSLNGYFPKIKNINNLLLDKSFLLNNVATDLVKYKADFELAEAGYNAATSAIEENKADFEKLVGIDLSAFTSNGITKVQCSSKLETTRENAEKNHAVYADDRDITSCSVYFTKNANQWIAQVTLTRKSSQTAQQTSVYIYPKVWCGEEKLYYSGKEVKCTFNEGSLVGFGTTVLEEAFIEREDTKEKLTQYATNFAAFQKYSLEKAILEGAIAVLTSRYDSYVKEIEEIQRKKNNLNQLFFSRFSRFIQEGTWMDEKYYDDDLYYADALSVLYNSCYPQVAYSINVMSLAGIPGYELYDFDLGDQTYIEDPDFFGEKAREEVVVSETVEHLDDPSQNTIKVQNFKNQFQDLFQKITATVQQTQYSTGAYKKAAALAEANQEEKQSFFSGALDGATARLTTAGQQSVTWGNEGITVQSVNSPCDQIRLVGGAILLSKQDENGQQKWTTGVTSDGVSASLITAGTINTSLINIMNGKEPAFRWDVYGISAYGKNENEQSISGKKFVRFDQHGIYGINNADGINGLSWHPDSIGAIDQNATFALTWEGLKVTGNENVVARIGKLDDNIMRVTRKIVVDGESQEQVSFVIKNDGSIETTGINIIDGTVNGEAIPTQTNIESWAAEYVKSEQFLKDSQMSDILGLGKTETGEDYIISPYIAGGYLNITGGGNRVLIDPQNNTGNGQVFQIYKNVKEGETPELVMGVDNDGNAIFKGSGEFSGKITAASGEINGFQIGVPEHESYPRFDGLIYGTRGAEGSFVILPGGNYSGFLTTIAGVGRTDWTLMVGNGFGVIKNGEMYSKAIHTDMIVSNSTENDKPIKLGDWTFSNFNSTQNFTVVKGATKYKGVLSLTQPTISVNNIAFYYNVNSFSEVTVSEGVEISSDQFKKLFGTDFSTSGGFFTTGTVTLTWADIFLKLTKI